MWIVIEMFPDIKQGMIVVDPDTGENKIFDTWLEAQIESEDCQNGLVVEIK